MGHYVLDIQYFLDTQIQVNKKNFDLKDPNSV